MRETRRERRYKGRAIRKARREQAAAVAAIDWAAVGRAFEAAAVFAGGMFGLLAGALSDAFVGAVEKWADVEAAAARAALESGQE